MSATADGPAASDHRVDDLPEFSLEYLLDDTIDPTEVTVFEPDDHEITTHWITIDISHAVPLDEVQ